MALTERDKKVLDMLAEGKCYKLIGRELGLCATTIGSQVGMICAKLDVKTRIEAVLKYKESIPAASPPEGKK